MRIAYVFDQILPNSATDTEQAVNTVGALTRQGVDVTMVLPRETFRAAPTADDLRTHYGVDGSFRVERLRSLYPAPRNVSKGAHAIRSVLDPRLRNYDIVYTRNIPMFVGGLLAGLPMVHETYRPWPRQHPALAPLFKWAAQRKTYVGQVLHSDYARQAFIQNGAAPDVVEVVHNGWDPRRYEPPTSRADARATIGIDVEGPVAVYTGRVNLRKGLGIVLDMAERTPDVRFLVVGSEGEGEVEARARTLDNVQVFGWQTYDSLPPFLFAADILIVPPSLAPLQGVGNTVLPMKLFLYLAAGRAILAPDAPDTAELLTHDENSWLIAPDDLDAACAAVRTLVDEDGVADRLGAASRALANGLTWDARAQKIIAFLDRRLRAMKRARV